MKIEAGKYYRTLSGKKAYVETAVGPSPFTGQGRTYPFFGYVDEYGPESWTAAGHVGSDCPAHQRNIVAEWRDPAVIEIDLIMYKRSDSTPPLLLRWGQSLSPSDKIVARKIVTITEGEGV
jgi:hypothetical protein